MIKKLFVKNSPSIYFHSKVVKFLRIFFPLLVMGILTWVIIWPNLMKSSFYPKIERAINKTNIAINPRIFSTNDQGKPYIIEAKIAEQMDEMSAKLDQPSGKFELEDGTKVEVSANIGDLKKKEDSLTLSGTVDLKSENGYTLKAPSAKVDLKTRTAETFESVSGKSPRGKIKADKGVKISSDGTVQFKGKTQLVIQPPSENNSDD